MLNGIEHLPIGNPLARRGFATSVAQTIRQRIGPVKTAGWRVAIRDWWKRGPLRPGRKLASYAGTTPRVHSSGDRTRYGRTRPDVNHYLKWAFAEAANSAAVNYRRCSERHVSQLHARLRLRKGHSRAVGAVAWHLAEAAFHVLSRHEVYRDPAAAAGRTTEV